MKMWQCAFFTLILIICVWLFSCGIIQRENVINKAAIEVNIVQQHSEEVTFIEENDTSGRNEILRGKPKHHVPKVMLEFYENSKSVNKNGFNNREPDIVRSVVPTHTGSHYLLYTQEDSNHDHHMLIFNVPNSNKDELFIGAELRVLTLIEIESKLALGIERQIKISLYNETTNKMKFLEEKHIYFTDNTWISFNVSHAVQSIMTDTSSDKNKILKFIITIKLFEQYKTNKTGILKLSLMPIEENLEHDYPVLLLFYANNNIKKNNHNHSHNNNHENGTVVNMRNKRHVFEEDYEEETNKIWDEELVNKAMNRKMKRMRNNCKRRPLYIDFAEIQYDSWIVQPSGYEAYQCAGKCFYPVAEHLSPTKHAIVQALLHSVAPARAPRSCCVPTKLDSISVLYVDTQGVLTYRYAYKDMVVTECGCR